MSRFSMSEYTVAVIGANGMLAGPIVAGLTDPLFRDRFVMPIRLLSFNSVVQPLPDARVYVTSDAASYETALNGVDIAIDLRSHVAFDLQSIMAAKRAGIRVYCSSDFTIDYAAAGKYTIAFSNKQCVAAAVRQLGMRSVQFHTGYLIEGLLGHYSALAFVHARQHYADYPDTDVQFSVTSVRDIGLSIASTLARPLDELPTAVRFAGQVISAAQFATIYEKYSGIALDRKPMSRADIIRRAEDHMISGTIATNLHDILRAVAIDAPGTLLLQHNDNDFVNPGLFKWTTVEEVAKRMLPFSFAPPRSPCQQALLASSLLAS